MAISPLHANEDHPHDNQNKTFYRDQVNKVANAIKGIMLGIKLPDKTIPENASFVSPLTKGVKRPVAKKIALAFIFFILSFVIYRLIESSKTTESIGKSIAVLPFVNMSNDVEQQYFTDGLSDAMRILLGKVNDLQVVGQVSSNYFKGKSYDIKEIGKNLGVDHILTGSVQTSETKLRINVILFRSQDEVQLWSESFTRTKDELFDLQDEIASKVAEKLKFIFLISESNQLILGTRNIEAYSYYLQGLKIYYLSHIDFNDSQLIIANDFFQKAIDLDPSFDLPYHFMADRFVHQLETITLQGAEREDAFNTMHQYFDKAIQYSTDSTRTKLFRLEKNLMSDNWRNVAELLDDFIQDPRAPQIASETGMGVSAGAFHLLKRGKDLFDICEKALAIDPLNTILWQFGADVLFEDDPQKGLEFLRKGEAIIKTRFARHDYFESPKTKLSPEEIEKIKMAKKLSHGHLLLLGYIFLGVDYSSLDFSDRFRELRSKTEFHK